MEERNIPRVSSIVAAVETIIQLLCFLLFILSFFHSFFLSFFLSILFLCREGPGVISCATLFSTVFHIAFSHWKLFFLYSIPNAYPICRRDAITRWQPP